jgi:hypothetical protein
MPVGVGVRPVESKKQSGVLVRVEFGSGVFDESRVPVGTMKGVSVRFGVWVGFGVWLGFCGSVGAGGSVGTIGSSVFVGGLSHNPSASPTPVNEVRQITPRIKNTLRTRGSSRLINTSADWLGCETEKSPFILPSRPRIFRLLNLL